MNTISKFIRILGILTLFVPVVAQEANASIHFKTLKSSGFVSQQMSEASQEVIRSKVDLKSESNFFNTTDLACSEIGAVKTYTIKKIIRKKSIDSFDIRGIIDESTDNNVTRFFNRPINGVLTSAFGYRIHPKRKKRHFHSGVDLAAKSGTPIACAGAGKVVYAGWKSGYGYVVMVDHGKGYETLYAHCSKLAVSAGQTVNAGKTIAYVGRTGVATGPHLHFEVRKNGAFQNPMKYLKN